MGYGISIRAQAPFAEAVARVRDALKAQGFGVLTEIDMRAILRDKLGEDREDYLILGACNPPLAHRALGIDASIGLLLPSAPAPGASQGPVPRRIPGRSGHGRVRRPG
jgi:uncharacterized protein (DUF302 family)